MSDVLIPLRRLRELEIAADLAANMLRAVSAADGKLVPMIDGMQEALAKYEARMALSDAMAAK